MRCLERAAVLLGVDVEARRERLERQRLPGLLHRLRDLVAARDLVLVAAFVGASPSFGLRGISGGLAARDSGDWLIIARHLSRAAIGALPRGVRTRLTAPEAVSTFLALRAPNAQVAELVDALVSGASGVTLVEVQVLSWAPSTLYSHRHPSTTILVTT